MVLMKKKTKRFLIKLLVTTGIIALLGAAIWFVRDIPYLTNSELAAAKLVAVVIAFFGFAIWFQRLPLTWKEVLVLAGIGAALLSFATFFRHTNLKDVTEQDVFFMKLSVTMVVIAGIATWAIKAKKRV